MRTQIINHNNHSESAVIDTYGDRDVITFHNSDEVENVDVIYFSKYEGYAIDTPVWGDLVRASTYTMAQVFVENCEFNDYGNKILDTIALNQETIAVEEEDCTMYVNIFPDGSKIYHWNDMIYTA